MEKKKKSLSKFCNPPRSPLPHINLSISTNKYFQPTPSHPKIYLISYLPLSSIHTSIAAQCKSFYLRFALTLKLPRCEIFDPDLTISVRLHRFALRRFSARSCKAASLLPSAQLQQASIAPRALSSIATCSKIARTPAPSVLSAIQRRNFTEDGDRRPSYGGGGNYGSNYGSNYGGGGNRGGRSFDSHRSPEGRPLKPTNVLYVGNLQFDVTEELLKGHFEGMGELAGVRVITDPQGMSKGYVSSIASNLFFLIPIYPQQISKNIS